MTTYQGNPDIYHNGVYIYGLQDPVLGGLNQVSNRPIQQIQDNFAYAQKYKGRIVQGSGAPTLSTLNGFYIDSNTENNVLYLDILSGSFWKPTIVADALAGWTNIYKSVTLNTNGIRLNNNGNDADYIQLKYDHATRALKFTTTVGAPADISVGKISFTRLNSSDAINELRIADNEILLLYNITQESENDDGLFSVKRLIDIPGITITGFDVAQTGQTVDTWYYTGTLPVEVDANSMVQIRGIPEQTDEDINGFYLIQTVFPTYFTTKIDFKQIQSSGDQSGLTGSLSRDNSAIIKWDEGNKWFELVDRDGSLLPLECAGFYINGVPQNFVPTRVISTTAQFDELFGNVQTGEDRCYLRKPETGYVTDISSEYIYLKYNANLGTNGNYTLQNRVDILGSNVKIECAPGVFIIQGNSSAVITTRNNTNLIVSADGYTKTLGIVNILSKNTYYTDGENNGDQYQLAVGSTVFGFSDSNSKVNKKYTIASVTKSLTELGKDIAAIDFADFSDHDISISGNMLIHAFVDAGIVNIQWCTYNSVTNQYENLSSPAWTSNQTDCSNVSISSNGNTVYVACRRSGTSDIEYAEIADITLTGAGFNINDQVEGTSFYNNPKVYYSSGKVYVLAKNGNTLRLCYNTVPVSSNFQFIAIETSDITSSEYDIIRYLNTLVISYSGTDFLNIALVNVSGTPTLFSNIAEPASTCDNSKLCLTEGGVSNPVYVLWNETQETGGYRDSIRLGEVNITGETIDNSQILIASTGTYQFNDFDVLVNSANLFNNNGHFIQVVAFDYFNNNVVFLEYDGLAWIANVFNMEAATIGQVIRLANDYMFLFKQNVVTGEPTEIVRYEYNVKVGLNENIDDGNVTATDIIISPDYLENLELILNFDGNSDSTIVNTALFPNIIDSKTAHNMKNCQSDNGVNFGNKVFYTSTKMKCLSDDGNLNTNNISGLSHGMITESYLENYIGKNLNNCNNVNVVAFLNTEPELGNGSYNE